MRQGAKVKRSLADEHGDHIEIGGQTVQRLPAAATCCWGSTTCPGSARRRSSASTGSHERPWTGGWTRRRCAALPEDEALARLRELPGVGPWTAQAVLMRGCGMPDTIPTEDAISREAVAALLRPARSARRPDMGGDLGSMASVPDVGHRAAPHGLAPPATHHAELSPVQQQLRATAAPRNRGVLTWPVNPPRRSGGGPLRGPCRGGGRAGRARACAAGSCSG